MLRKASCGCGNDRSDAAHLHVPVEELRAAAGSSQMQVANLAGVADALAIAADPFGQMLEQREDELRLRELQARFLGMVGHDLSNSITAVRLGSDTLLRNGTLRDKDARVASLISHSIRRTSHMVDQLLDLTRSRLGGGIQLKLQCFDLGLLCHEMAAEAELAFPGTRVRVECVGDTVMNGDPHRVEQILSNLLGNAHRYGSAGAPIDVSLTTANDVLVLRVRNEGVPIPADVVPVLFEPFNRAKQRESAAGKREGLGLGLFIVQQVVEAHGGTIEVSSSAKDGTAFTVRLPRKK